MELLRRFARWFVALARQPDVPRAGLALLRPGDRVRVGDQTRMLISTSPPRLVAVDDDRETT